MQPNRVIEMRVGSWLLFFVLLLGSSLSASESVITAVATH